MQRSTRWWVIGLVAVALVAAITLTRFPPTPGPSPNPSTSVAPPVRVAMNLPLTGPFGIYGQTVRDGATLAVADLSARGTRIELDVQDNLGTPNGAVTVFQKQSLDPYDIYSSGVKPQTMAIFDRVLESGHPYFVWVFDASLVDRNPTVFRTWVNYKYEPEKYLQYIRAHNAKRVAIACVNLPHAIEEFNSILIPQLRQAGVQTTIEIYDFDTKQHRDIIAKLGAAKPDLFILNGFQENLVAMVRAVRTLGLFHDDNVIGTYDLLDAAKLLAKEELEGMRVVAPDFNITEGANVAEWKRRFRARFKREPLYTDAYSYDMVQVIADAARRLKLPASAQQWIDALKSTDVEGVTGRLRFDEGGDLKLALRIGVYRGGALQLDVSEQER